VDQNLKTILDNLTKIADEAKRVLEAHERMQGAGQVAKDEGAAGDCGDREPNGSPPEEFIACTPRQLPKKLLVQAALAAIKLNPANAPFLQGPMAALGRDMPPLEPIHIAVLTSKYWGAKQRELTVSFMERVDPGLRDKILSHMNAWHDGKPGCGIKFVWTQGTGQVRISFQSGGYWSYLGPDILQIPQNRQTMNLERFSLQTPDSEFFRVVRHETGHTLGFPHEHMRGDIVREIDPQKATEWFGRTQGWDANTVQQQVLTPLEERSLMATPTDQTSIMCYQLPGSITRSGKPIVGGTDINASDRTFAAKIYPLPGGDDAWSDDNDWFV
jgi:hypothetical protein